MRKYLMLVVSICLGLQAVVAAGAETTFIPFKLYDHMMIEGVLTECTSSNDEVTTTVMWGAEANEVYKALARENGLEEANFDFHYGPFRSYRDYSLGIKAHSQRYVQFLRQKDFLPEKLILKNEDGSVDRNQNLDALMARVDGSVEKPILEIAREKGWARITAVIGGFTVKFNSESCRKGAI